MHIIPWKIFPGKNLPLRGGGGWGVRGRGGGAIYLLYIMPEIPILFHPIPRFGLGETKTIWDHLRWSILLKSSWHSRSAILISNYIFLYHHPLRLMLHLRCILLISNNFWHWCQRGNINLNTKHSFQFLKIRQPCPIKFWNSAVIFLIWQNRFYLLNILVTLNIFQHFYLWFICRLQTTTDQAD